MKSIFAKVVAFVRENPSLLFSLVLVVLIPAAFFINTYLINSSYERNIDKITQQKAVLVENIINIFLENQFGDDSALQASLGKIIAAQEEIVSLSILKKNEDFGNFKIAASSDQALIGQESQNIQNLIAWDKPEGVAFLDSNERGRFWNVTKALTSQSGEKIGLVSISFSLAGTDALVRRTIYNSYWILIVTVLIVILFVSNQARLFGYALTLSKLKEIDKMKDMFISMASHELRTPLTAIKGYLEFLKDKDSIKSDRDSNHYVENISISVERLNSLVEDVLEVSRVEGNRLPIEITNFDPYPIIKQSTEELRMQADKKGLTLEYHPIETTSLIAADVNRLKQVLINLIGNSLKYTEKGSVSVTAETKGNYFLITIADTGIGISAEDQANLFQRFYRVKNDHTKNIIGTGLGLWLTLEIVKRMKGKITVESIEGVGSHFTVYLPLAKNQ